MDARIETVRLLCTLTEYARHFEECLDWWRLNQKENYPAVRRWLEETDNVILRYPAPGNPTLTYAMVKNHTGTYKADPHSRYWNKPGEGEKWRYSDEEELFFGREFTAEELRGYRIDFKGLLQAIALVLGLKPLTDDNHFCFFRLGLMEGRPAFLAVGHIKTVFPMIFELLSQNGKNTTIFTIGTNVVIDFLKKQHDIDIRDLSLCIHVAPDGSLIPVKNVEHISVDGTQAAVAKHFITDKTGKQYLVAEDCGSYTEYKSGKADSKSGTVILRPLAKAYLKVLLNNLGKSIKRNELEQLALAELKKTDSAEVLPNDTRISEAFRTTTDKGTKKSLAIYKVIHCKKGWGGGSYMLPADHVVKQ